MNVLRVNPGVEFLTIAPGGFAILASLEQTAQLVGHDIVITSACDGKHSGPDDPHHRGMAYDIRTHDVPDKTDLLETLESILADYGADRFYAFIEDPGTDNEHIHVQVKKGTEYP